MADQEALTFAFDGHEYKIDDFTLGECEYLEDEMGQSLGDIPWGSMKAAVRIIYLIRRREDPDFTLDDARNMKISVFDDQNGNGSERPTSGRGKKKGAATTQTSPPTA